jgi:glycoprotein-N-acetylgalactosamine 3-beta-galactosyltransferase
MERIEANLNDLEILKPYGLVKDEYSLLTDKIYRTYIDVYKKYGDYYDWFLKADDDTYVFMDNLRLYLKSLKQGERLFYYGHKFYLGSFNYNSGGAGYVLPRVVMRKLVNKLTSNYSLGPNSGLEDMDVGKLLKKLNIYAKLALDSGKILFHPFNIKHYLNQDFNLFQV